MTPEDVLGSSRDDNEPGQRARLPRRWRVLLVVAVVLAAGALLGPDLLSSPGVDDADEAGDRRASSPPSRAPQPVVPGPLAEDLPVRGDLADDQSFVDAALRRVRAGHPDADRVLYAATLPDGGRVAFVGRDRDEPEGIRALDVYALKVPPGAPIEAGEITVIGRGLIETTSLLGWAGRGGDGVVYAVILGPPGGFVGQVSERVDYRPDGTGSRQWRDVRASGDGSVTVDLGTRTDPVVVARSTTGPADYPALISVDGRSEGMDRAVTIQGADDARYRGPEMARLVDAVLNNCRALLDVAAADIRVIWSGDLDPAQPAALLRIRRPDGPAFQLLVSQATEAELAEIDGGETQVDAVEPFAHGPLSVPWEAADVIPWLLFESGDPSRPPLLINPSGAGTAAVSYPDEPPRRVTFGPDGRAPLGVGAPSAPNLYLATVEVRSPAGELVVKARLTTVSNEDPLVLGL